MKISNTNEINIQAHFLFNQISFQKNNNEKPSRDLAAAWLVKISKSLVTEQQQTKNRNCKHEKMSNIANCNIKS